MFQASRRRLALWYTTVTAVLLLLFASGFYFYARSTLIERVDDTLSHIVEVVERSLVIEPDVDGLIWTVSGQVSQHVNVEASFRNNEMDGDDDRIDIEWFSPKGELLWTTFDGPLTRPIKPEKANQKKGETVTVEEQRYGEPVILRQLTDRVQSGRQTLGYLRVSHPWFEVSTPTRKLLLDLVGWTGLVIAAVGTIGWFLSGLAMQPVVASYGRLKQFTADASHELRNPIAMIQTNVQAALVAPDDDPAAQSQQLLVVERLTRRLGRLVDDLLFLARQDSGMVMPAVETVALDEVLTEVVEEQLSQALKKPVELLLEFDEPGSEAGGEVGELEVFEVEGDRDQLTRLFTNLISNAIQYTPPEGQVQVHISQASEAGRVMPLIVVRVEDTGIGIPTEDLAHLFERFYRVDPARSRREEAGSGLGLAIAWAIVEQHQGHIQVVSQKQQGTTFTVTLPALSV